MKRFLRWLIPLAIVALVLYFLVVWFTGQQTRAAANVQFNTFQQNNPQVEIEHEWIREGFWRSEAILRARFEVPIEDELLVWVVEQPMDIHHSIFRSFVSGELSLYFNERNITEEVFGEQAIEVEGTAGQGGVSLTYNVPELNYEVGELGFHAAPVQLELVLTEDEQHSRVQLPLFTVQPVGSEDGVFVRDLIASSQTRLRNGEPLDGYTEIRLGSVSITEHGQTLHSMQNMTSETRFNRDGGELFIQQLYDIENMNVGGMPLTASLELEIDGLPYRALQNYSQSAQTEDDLQLMIDEILNSGASIDITRLDVDMNDWGQLQGAGEFHLASGVTVDMEDILSMVSGYMEFTELPMMVQLSFAELGADELPLRIELQDGTVLLNGVPLPN